MENPDHLNFAVTCRALAVYDNALLMCRLHPKFSWYCLPGGKLNVGESAEEAMARELMEETSVKADIGKLLIINEWINPHEQVHRIEFLFWIRNASDFRGADYRRATHGHELVDLTFGRPADPKFDLRPAYLIERFERIAALGDDYPTELVTSRT